MVYYLWKLKEIKTEKKFVDRSIQNIVRDWNYWSQKLQQKPHNENEIEMKRREINERERIAQWAAIWAMKWEAKWEAMPNMRRSEKSCVKTQRRNQTIKTEIMGHKSWVHEHDQKLVVTLSLLFIIFMKKVPLIFIHLSKWKYHFNFQPFNNQTNWEMKS